MEQLVEGLASELAVADIRVIGTQPRPEWVLVDMLVHPDRRLFAKVALPEEIAPVMAKRPRLVPVLGDGRRLQSEAEALSRLAQAVPPDDPDLAAVSVVHRQDSPAALVVDWVDGQALSVALGPFPRRGIPHDPAEMLRKAGRWLELFHSLTGAEKPAYRYPDDVLKWLGEVEDHLGARARRWAALVAALTDAVERHGDLRPQVAVHHGDMAARNLMVRADGRIVGIDAGVEWQAPRSHDLAVFLTDLELRAPHRTRGRVPDFVRGYGYRPGESPTSLIFRTVAVLDRYLAWLARVQDREGAVGRRTVEGMRLNRLAETLLQGLAGRKT